MVDVKTVQSLESQIFPDVEILGDRIATKHLNWTVFSPSHYFRDPQLITDEMINNLRKGKKILSVGSGPAYLERVLVKRFGIPRKNITLSDITKTNSPKDFKFKRFDMFGKWPIFDTNFDYIIFPESVFFAKITPQAIYMADDEKAMLYHIIENSMQRLNEQGMMRIKGLPTDEKNVHSSLSKIIDKYNVRNYVYQKEFLAVEKL